MADAVSTSRGLRFVMAAAGLLIACGLGYCVYVYKHVEWTYFYAGTRRSLEEVAGELQNYHQKNGAFPPGFKVSDLANPRLPSPADGWGYVLKVTDHGFVLTCWARDGKLGGTGYDQDIVVSWKAGEGAPTVQAADISP